MKLCQQRLLQFFSAAVLLLWQLNCLVSPSQAYAEFLQTDLNTYQLPDAHQQVIIVTTPRGMFIAQTSGGKSGSISLFDLDKLTLSNSTSVFLAYGADSRVPEKLLLPGAGNEYRIRGTFSIQLNPEVRVSAAMNAGSIPYVSVVFTRPNKESIIGFLGDQVVLNLAGAEAVTLLEAEILTGGSNDAIRPYTVTADSHLSLGTELVQAGTGIGLLSPQDNECLEESAQSMPVNDFEKLSQLKGAEQQVAIRKIAAAPVKSQSLSQFMILNSASSRSTAINAESGKLVTISEREIGEAKFCVVEPIELKKLRLQ